MNRTRRIAAGVLTGLLLVGVAAACGSDDDGGQAGSEARITLYSGRNENLIAPLIAQFEQETGIKVDVRYGDTAQMAAQLLTEGERTPAHVFLAQDAGALGAVANAGMFAALPADVLNRVPETYRDAEGRWVGVTGRSRVLVYSTERVPEADLPDSVLELTDPKWRGRLGIAPTNASFQAFVTALRVMHGEDVAREWLQGILANEPQIRERNGQIVADVIEGRLDAGLVNHYYLFEQAKERGVAPDQLGVGLHFFAPGDVGALVNVSGVGVLKHAADDPNVRKFVDYLLSETGQRYFAEQTFEYPLIAGVAGPAGAPSLEELNPPAIDLNDLESLEETIALITEIGLA